MTDYIVTTQIKGSLDPNDQIRVLLCCFGIGRIPGILFLTHEMLDLLYCFTALISKLPTEILINGAEDPLHPSTWFPGWFRLKTATLDVRNSYLE